MDVILQVIGGSQNGQQYPVTAPEFLIGRGADCHLRPQRLDVSRMHCTIVLRDEHVYLRDQGSTNGTILNRRVLVSGEVPVKDGDRFEVGPVTFQVMILTADSARPAQPAEAAGDSFLDTVDVVSGPPSTTEPSGDVTIAVTRPNLAGIRNLDDAGEKLC